MGVPLERALKGISDAGFGFVELLSIPNWIVEENVSPKMSKEELRKVKKLLDDYGLRIVSLSGHIDYLAEKSRDTKIVVAALKDRIELASQLGCKYINTGAWTTDKQIFYESVPELIDACSRHDISLGLEVGEPGLTATGRGLIELLSDVKSNKIGINYDTGNIRWLLGIEPETDLPFTFPRLIHFHLKDQLGGKGVENYPALGKGEIKFATIFAMLKEVSFKGPVTVEIEMPCDNLELRDKEVQESFSFARRYVN
jgi:sugar phosphate isomerase/epimerase